MDIILASTWRFEGLSVFARGGGGQGLTDSDRDEAAQYAWRDGRIEVIVRRDGDFWRVRSTSAGRLFGPREVLYEARHKQAKHAAWDVMACVIRASQNEDAGVNAGREAARWMLAHRVSSL
jgi:hypothetical protein